MTETKSLFKYFGGKSASASSIWGAFGDPGLYIEPFCGSAAVLLARPRFTGHRMEIINDLDGWLVNVWRSVKADPKGVALECVGPMTEIDITARKAWLNGNRESFTSWLMGDPEHYDSKAAAWWLTVACGSIGTPISNGPWGIVDGKLTHIGAGGVSRSIPSFLDNNGVYSPTIDVDKRIHSIAQRLRDTRIACGDWRRVLSDSIISGSKHSNGDGSTAIFLDPPYTVGSDVYFNNGDGLSKSVRDWCMNAPGGLKIVVCGYLDEHDELLDRGWMKIEGKAGSSGYGAVPASERERLWLSPSCTKPIVQEAIF
ncbi:hypothetical protein HMPREF1301_00214 [Propionibacterium sp. KPL2005]|nr:hypothetical protein HMPREF1301_00214 [Propionibacterium sp. KPL2005]ERS26728.1 hypothetical protein HMPREF1297_02318 [Propionibacterium sp. KPL2000]